MLTRETYPKFAKKDAVADGGHYQAGLSFGDLSFPDGDTLGFHHEEKGEGYETCTVQRGPGELVEAFVSDGEVGICFDDTIMAVYGRETGALNCASFSLVRGVLDASRFDVRMNRVIARKAKELLGEGSDIVVVANFDDDGEERMSLVMTDKGRVSRTLAAARIDDMGDDYGFPEDKDKIDFVTEDEEEWVGGLLRAWRCVSPIGEINFGVGVRELTLDFVMINPIAWEGVPYRVAQQLDFLVLDGRRIDPQLVILLAEAAFPGMV